jgi:dimethylargininase
VVPVALRAVPHLKSAVTALPEGTIIGSDESPSAPERSRRCASSPRVRRMLGGGALLMAARAPQ